VSVFKNHARELGVANLNLADSERKTHRSAAALDHLTASFVEHTQGYRWNAHTISAAAAKERLPEDFNPVARVGSLQLLISALTSTTRQKRSIAPAVCFLRFNHSSIESDSIPGG